MNGECTFCSTLVDRIVPGHIRDQEEVARLEQENGYTDTLTAAGAHLILFTTGRGTPFGAPAPTMKLSTNTALAEKKKPGLISTQAWSPMEHSR